jgi:5'-3' exonuclease
MNSGDYSIIYNFFRSLRVLIEKTSPDVAYFVLEGVPKLRLEKDATYKANRKYEDGDNFSIQKKSIISLVKEYFPLVVARHSDYECDDIIGHLTNEYKENNNVTIVSSDTDFIQSIDANVKLYNPVKKVYLENPEYDYVSWKSLVGDKADNIVGFAGVGDKKAKKLLNDSLLLETFLSSEGNREKYEKNKFMISFHDLSAEEDNIQYSLANTNEDTWIQLREKFNLFKFKSISEKDRTWNKFVSTFSNLEGEV